MILLLIVFWYLQAGLCLSLAKTLGKKTYKYLDYLYFFVYVVFWFIKEGLALATGMHRPSPIRVLAKTSWIVAQHRLLVWALLSLAPNLWAFGAKTHKLHSQLLSIFNSISLANLIFLSRQKVKKKKTHRYSSDKLAVLTLYTILLLFAWSFGYLAIFVIINFCSARYHLFG